MQLMGGRQVHAPQDLEFTSVITLWGEPEFTGADFACGCQKPWSSGLRTTRDEIQRPEKTEYRDQGQSYPE